MSVVFAACPVNKIVIVFSNSTNGRCMSINNRHDMIQRLDHAFHLKPKLPVKISLQIEDLIISSVVFARKCSFNE